MPRFDGTGPLGLGMLTGRGEGYCALRLPDPGSGERATGYSGIQGQPVQLAPDFQLPLATAGAEVQARMPNQLLRQGRRRRLGRRRCESQRWVAR